LESGDIEGLPMGPSLLRFSRNKKIAVQTYLAEKIGLDMCNQGSKFEV